MPPRVPVETTAVQRVLRLVPVGGDEPGDAIVAPLGDRLVHLLHEVAVQLVQRCDVVWWEHGRRWARPQAFTHAVEHSSIVWRITASTKPIRSQ
jgi:hypothetical protein